MPLERLQKIISTAGIASRRKAEEMITAGRVSVNGAIVSELGAKADPESDTISVDGKPLRSTSQHLYLMMHKPKGHVTTTSDPEGRPTVMDLLPPNIARVYPVGRLDWATEGLLLFTNDGDLAYKLTHASTLVPKTYLVKVAGKPAEDEIARLRRGVHIEKTNEGGEGPRVKTAPARIRWVHESDNPWLEVTLIEGRNRQIRKMFEEVGHHVEKIRRVAYGPIELEKLPIGAVRQLSLREVISLKQSAGLMKGAPPESARERQAAPQGEAAAPPPKPSAERSADRPRRYNVGVSSEERQQRRFRKLPTRGGSRDGEQRRQFGTRAGGQRKPPFRDRADGEKRGFGAGRPAFRDRADGAARRDSGDRPPRRDFSGERSARPPRRDFSERPRSGSERPKREFGARPPRREFDSGEKRPPRREFGSGEGRPPRRDRPGDRSAAGPRREFRSRSEGSSPRPPRRESGSGEGRPPRRDRPSGDRSGSGPRREFRSRSEGSSARPPRREFSSREGRPPRREFSSRSGEGQRGERRPGADRQRSSGGRKDFAKDSDRPFRSTSKERTSRFGERRDRTASQGSRDGKSASQPGRGTGGFPRGRAPHTRPARTNDRAGRRTNGRPRKTTEDEG